MIIFPAYWCQFSVSYFLWATKKIYFKRVCWQKSFVDLRLRGCKSAISIKFPRWWHPHISKSYCVQSSCLDRRLSPCIEVFQWKIVEFLPCISVFIGQKYEGVPLVLTKLSCQSIYLPVRTGLEYCINFSIDCFKHLEVYLVRTLSFMFHASKPWNSEIFKRCFQYWFTSILHSYISRTTGLIFSILASI